MIDCLAMTITDIASSVSIESGTAAVRGLVHWRPGRIRRWPVGTSIRPRPGQR